MDFFADVLALASSIGELTLHTRKARTAMWCALQMAGKDVPQLRMLSGTNGIPQPSLTTNLTATSTGDLETSDDVQASAEPSGDKPAHDNNDSNNNSTTMPSTA